MPPKITLYKHFRLLGRAGKQAARRNENNLFRLAKLNYIARQLSSIYNENSYQRVEIEMKNFMIVRDVVQEAVPAEVTAPAQGGRRTRKTWTKQMNIFIMRHYFILTDLESNTRTYLTPLHARFTAEFPDMNASKQRVGDQRRAIVQRNFLTNEEISNIKAEVRLLLQHDPTASQNTDTTHIVSRRMRWTDQLNETIMKSYYRLTNLETDFTTYRTLLHEDIISKCPSIAHLSAQRIADQRRSIVNNQLLSTDRLNQIREEVRNELALIRSNSPDYTNIIPQQITPETITQHNDNVESTTPINTNDQNTQQLAQITANLSPEIIEQLEQMYSETYNKFKNSDPTARPYIPKLRSSRKLASITSCLNTHILPMTLTSDTDFNTLQTRIYCAAYTAAKFNGAKIRENTQCNYQPEKVPWWQKRLELLSPSAGFLAGVDPSLDLLGEACLLLRIGGVTVANFIVDFGLESALAGLASGFFSSAFSSTFSCTLSTTSSFLGDSDFSDSGTGLLSLCVGATSAAGAGFNSDGFDGDFSEGSLAVATLGCAGPSVLAGVAVSDFCGVLGELEGFSGGFGVLGEVLAISCLSLLDSGFCGFNGAGAFAPDLGESIVPLACPVESGSVFSGVMVRARALSWTRLRGVTGFPLLVGLAAKLEGPTEFWVTCERLPW
ncbi:hypothetical protein SFRURICE_004282 [Spodoptera frugiperda]|nr:hypothetical protein SFRURICE_004282 [Spodoptera frugiperda]